MKVLNLDKLDSKQVRQLVIGGKSYPVEEMTVGNFIETTRSAERVAEASIADQIEATVEMIQRSVPTLERSLLEKLSLEQLQTIVAFVRGDAVEGVEEEKAPAKGGVKGAKK